VRGAADQTAGPDEPRREATELARISSTIQRRITKDLATSALQMRDPQEAGAFFARVDRQAVGEIFFADSGEEGELSGLRDVPDAEVSPAWDGSVLLRGE
jgi:hypothetical protein